MMIYLASTSPRRRELLAQIGVSHGLLAVDVDESALPGESAEAYVMRLARAKAQAGWQVSDLTRPVMGADTTLALDGRILGKPRDRTHFLEMFRALSGTAHEVLSAVALVSGDREQTVLSVSRVVFRDISEAEMLAYWHGGEPADKAGGYGIQGKGALFVDHLEGSYSGVMGLPLRETGALLADFGISLLESRG